MRARVCGMGAAELWAKMRSNPEAHEIKELVEKWKLAFPEIGHYFDRKLYGKRDGK